MEITNRTSVHFAIYLPNDTIDIPAKSYYKKYYYHKYGLTANSTYTVSEVQASSIVYEVTGENIDEGSSVGSFSIVDITKNSSIEINTGL